MRVILGFGNGNTWIDPEERENRVEITTVKRATLTEQSEEALRLDIILGVFRPGERLRAVELAARYGVSPTPLREALQRLAADGLVDLDPRLGATVSDVSTEDLKDVYDVRLMLESEALYRSLTNGGTGWVEVLTERLASLRTATASDDAPFSSREAASRWSAAHRLFHLALFANCGSRWLTRFVTTLYDHSERYRMLERGSLAGDRNTLEEHERIYEAAVRRDAPTAVRRLQAHLQVTVTGLEASLRMPRQDARPRHSAGKDSDGSPPQKGR